MTGSFDDGVCGPYTYELKDGTTDLQVDNGVYSLDSPNLQFVGTPADLGWVGEKTFYIAATM